MAGKKESTKIEMEGVKTHGRDERIRQLKNKKRQLGYTTQALCTRVKYVILKKETVLFFFSSSMIFSPST